MEIENLMWIKAWKSAGNMDVPAFMGRKWDMMADDPATEGDEAHGFTPHHDQRIWLSIQLPPASIISGSICLKRYFWTQYSPAKLAGFNQYQVHVVDVIYPNLLQRVVVHAWH